LYSFQDVKEQIRRSVDLVDLVSGYVSLRRSGRNMKGLCPFHKEKTPSFNVFPERQIFKCFGCHAGGDVFKFVQLMEHVEFGEAVRLLADRLGISLKPSRAENATAPSVGRADLLRANEWAAKWFRAGLLGQAGARARAYVEKRGISPEMTERFEIGLAVGDGHLADAAQRAGISAQVLLAADLVRASEQGGGIYETFRERLMFPIRDAAGRCIAFGGRALGDSPAKYLNTARTDLFDKSRCLFGLPLARQALHESGTAIVVEGYTDCIACHQYGFANTLATLGTAATEEHMRVLRRHVGTAVLLFDSDAAGQAAAERALAVALQQDLTVRIAQVPRGKDPAEFLQASGPAEFSELLNSAVDALRFMWARTLTRFASPEGGQRRRQAVDEFIKLVGELGEFGAVDAIQRGVIIHQVARLLALPAEEVAALFSHQHPRRGEPAGTDAVPAAGTRPVGIGSDAEQKALLGMLEILVCEPGLLGEVADVFHPERIREPSHQRIAQVVLQLAERYGEFGTAELLAALESPAEADLVTDMLFRAERRGNLAATLQGIKQQVAFLDEVRCSREAAAHLKRQPGATDALAADALDNYLAAVQQGYAQYHHFAAAGQAFREEATRDDG
jgi:DNA primase